MSAFTEAREAKLPRWARIELDRLRQNLDAAHAALGQVTGEEPTNTVAHSGVDRLHPLPDGATVRFTDDQGHEFDVEIRKGELRVLGRHGGLAIRPDVSNVVTVHLVPHS